MSRLEKPKGFWNGVLSACAMIAMSGLLLGLKHAEPVDLFILLAVHTVLFINTVWCWTCT